MDLKQKQMNLNSTDHLNGVFFFFLAIDYPIKTIRQRVNRVIYFKCFLQCNTITNSTKHNTNIFCQLSSQ